MAVVFFCFYGNVDHLMSNGIMGSNAFVGSITGSLSLSISIIQLPFLFPVLMKLALSKMI